MPPAPKWVASSWSTPRRNWTKVSTITGLTNGGFVITWVDGSGWAATVRLSIKAQVFDAAGTKVGSEFLVNTTTEDQQNFPTVTGLSNGGFVVTWRDGSGLDGDSHTGSIKAQVFDATGKGRQRIPRQHHDGVNTPYHHRLKQRRLCHRLEDNSDVAATARASIKAQVFDATGNKVGSEFLVNTTTAG